MEADNRSQTNHENMFFLTLLNFSNLGENTELSIQKARDVVEIWEYELHIAISNRQPPYFHQIEMFTSTPSMKNKQSHSFLLSSTSQQS